MPREETFKKWAAESQKGFMFSLKIPMDITHKLRLRDIDAAWAYFHQRALSCLHEKCGPFLFQLPPTLKRDDDRLRALAKLIPDGE